MLRNVLSSTGSIQLVTIDIDTQINFTADEFWLSKTIGFDFSHDARNTAQYSIRVLCMASKPIQNNTNVWHLG